MLALSEKQRLELRAKYVSVGDKVESLLRTEELESEKNLKVYSRIKIAKAKLKAEKEITTNLREEIDQQKTLLQKCQNKLQIYKERNKQLKELVDTTSATSSKDIDVKEESAHPNRSTITVLAHQLQEASANLENCRLQLSQERLRAESLSQNLEAAVLKVWTQNII
jgi:hypothetical protein